MNVTKESKAISLQVTEGLTVSIIPNNQHQFLMKTQQVADGYGISPYTIRRHSMEHSLELVEGKHFVKGVSILNTLPNAQPHQVFWTKRGVVRLGFFIKSERAKLLRDWAEDFIIEKLTQQTTLFDMPATKQLKGKGKFGYNRLTPDRLIDILQDVCLIEDKDLRIKIAAKLKGGNNG